MRTDVGTGEMVLVGKSGRVVKGLELQAIEDAANAGDAAALAVRRDLDFSVDDHGRALSHEQSKAMLAASIHDCPECQAARARGEVGITLGPDELRAVAQAARGHGPYPSRDARRRKVARVDRRRKIARAARAANR